MIDSLGATERPEFVQIVTGMADGARVVAALADTPEEAQRILQLPPLVMAQELAKMSLKIAAPRSASISGAPPPIKPIDGAARTNEEPSDDDPQEAWFAKRAKQVKARGARF